MPWRERKKRKGNIRSRSEPPGEGCLVRRSRIVAPDGRAIHSVCEWAGWVATRVMLGIAGGDGSRRLLIIEPDMPDMKEVRDGSAPVDHGGEDGGARGQAEEDGD